MTGHCRSDNKTASFHILSPEEEEEDDDDDKEEEEEE
eukprot:CAMPEP_0116564366 /NCGR_PEP_ID=MMETSP0397-20121206/13268_1 /TAXON_ID=216820 /ORGANISM="Cyclophora tenuis, Strain ECT3854" /LENGTH=36 /DNA_ID= /DNA_START= /DNA_END= /DNA_ORIENTATION=